VDLAELIKAVNRRLEQTMERHLKPRGMSIEQFRVLETLSRQNGLPMGDLAARLFIDAPTLTRIIDKMVASAEVYRGPDPHDRRKVLIFLSKKGIAQFEDNCTLGSATQQDLVSRLGPAKTGSLADLLSELLASLQTPGKLDSTSEPIEQPSRASRTRETH
jgi:DNA-binding MarR family transcriptional regulator